MQSYKVLVFDDEPPARDELVYLLNRHKDVEVISTGENGYQAVLLTKKHNPDVVFMDIQMPGMNGFQAAKEIILFNNKIKIVFVTAYEEYAVKAFELNAMDYILKPYDSGRIDKTIERLKKETQGSGMNEKFEKLIEQLGSRKQASFQKVPCEKKGRIILIDPVEIIYCFVEDGQVYVKTSTEKLLSHSTLQELEEKLGFFRTHRSYLINIDKIEGLSQWFHGTYKLTMKGCPEEEIPVSRGQAKRLRTIIGI